MIDAKSRDCCRNCSYLKKDETMGLYYCVEGPDYYPTMELDDIPVWCPVSDSQPTQGVNDNEL